MIWGREDVTIPIAAKAVFERWNPAARQAVIDGAGHGLAYTHAEAVVAAMMD